MSPEDTPAEGQTPEPTESNEGQTPAEPAKAETFDKEYVSKLRSENAAARKARQDLEAKLTEYEDRDKSELEKLTTKLSKAEQAKADAEARLTRFEVAAEKEVPADALDFLTGSTREELEASADKLLELVKSRSNDSTPDFDGGARDIAPKAETPDEAHQKLLVDLLFPS